MGFEEKQFTRTHTSTFLRACRALTVWRLCGEATNDPKNRSLNESARTAGYFFYRELCTYF